MNMQIYCKAIILLPPKVTVYFSSSCTKTFPIPNSSFVSFNILSQSSSRKVSSILSKFKRSKESIYCTESFSERDIASLVTTKFNFHFLYLKSEKLFETSVFR